jgi:hypothetical protein
VTLLLLSIVIAAVLGGCSSGPSVAYKDGFNIAQNIARGQTFLASGPATECSLLASRGLVPSQDDEGQWEAGCQAALAHANFLHVPVPGS